MSRGAAAFLSFQLSGAASAACARGGEAPAAHVAAAPASESPAAAAPAASETAATQEPAPKAPAGPHDATDHHGFSDVQEWAKLFDDPARDAWQKPADVVDGLSIQKGMVVADLGAGTGYFESYLSKAVGLTGLVLAVDPEPEMVKYLGRRARKAGLDNVLPVLGLFEDPLLPKGRVNRVLIVDTYHHIDDRLAYFDRMKGVLAAGGTIAVVDFHKKPLPVGPPPEHKLDRQFVVDEMQQAGWRLKDEKTFLPYQYFLIFEPAGAAAGAQG